MIARRLREAAEEIRNYSLYDYVLVNREVEASVDTLVSIVKATRSRRDRMEEQIRPDPGDVFVACLNLISETPPRA